MFFSEWDKKPSVTPVPNSFILNHMKDAPGEYVKVFLYLLMASDLKDPELTPEKLALILSCTKADIVDALKYWESQKCLDLYYRDDNVTGVRITLDPFEKKKESHRLAQDRVRSFINENSEAKRLLFVTEQYFGRPLTPIETSTLLYFMDELGFSFDLCDYLVQYCVSKGHKSIKYIEKVALEWHMKGYTSPEVAKAGSSNWSKIHFEVLKAFGIRNRNPIPKEVEYIDKWYKEYCFSVDIIAEACSITLTSTGKQSYEYADGILSRWHASGIKTLSDIKRSNDEHKKSAGYVNTNKFHNFKQRDDDLDELEKKLDRQFAHKQ